MESENAGKIHKLADPGALGNITIGFLILIQTALLTGKVDPITSIALVPYILVGYPVLLTVIILQFRRGDVFLATANGFLGVILLGQGAIAGIINLIFVLSGKVQPQALSVGGLYVGGTAFLCVGIILIFVGYLLGYMLSDGAIAVWLASLSFLSLSAASFGYGAILALIGGYGLCAVGVWFVYSGIAMLVNGTLNKPVLPLGKPFFHQ